MKRSLRPRQPIAVASVYVSQLTSLQLLSVDHRRYLDHVVPHPVCRGHVTALGKLRLLPIEIAIEALRSMAANDREDGPIDPPIVEDRQPETSDAVLAALGLEAAR